MKEKIIAAFKVKFPSVNLSKARLTAIAGKIEKVVVDDETKIDAALIAFDEIADFKQIAIDDDKSRTAAARVKELENLGKPATEKTEKAEEFKVDEDAPAWAKAMFEQNKALIAKVESFEGKQQGQTILAKATEKLKEVPVTFWNKRAMPTKEEELDAFVEEVNTDFKTLQESFQEKGLSFMASTATGATGTIVTHNKTDKVDPAVEAFVKKSGMDKAPAVTVADASIRTGQVK